ncbi:MAG TPA: hypothetical protein VJQ43_03470, partial [Thermoplasmata archaeon]|nr:hypothetical protein [Thermoplasmata archaeon]
ASVAALGSLSGAFPAPGTHDLVFLVYAALGAYLLIPYATLSVATEPPARKPLASPPPLRPAVRTLAALFALDAFAGGLIPNALVAYLFVLNFHATLEVVGFVLFLGTLGAAASLLFAEPLAARFGLVRTMVGSHLPSNVLLIAVAAAPDLGIAATLWISRSLLSQIDVPTRQALTQALVPAGQRAAAAGWTTAARSTQAAGAPVSGVLAGLGAGLVAVPFALAGAIKIVYDLIFYARFRSEEVRASDLLSSRGPTEDDAPVGSHR